MIEQTILFTQKHKLLVKYRPSLMASRNPHAQHQLILTLNRLLESQGYLLSKNLMDYLMKLGLLDLNKWIEETLPLLQKELGIRRNSQAFYPNFPKQVIAMEEMDLYYNALHHYWTEGEYRPEADESFTYPLVDFSELKVIELGTIEDLVQLFTDKCQSVAGLNELDKEFMKWFILIHPDLVSVALPTEIPHRETATFLAAELRDRSDIDLSLYIKNATEVLRLATYLSNGDIHLQRPCQMRSFPRSERRLFMELLSKVKHDISEELWQRRECWLRFSEKVHPMEFKQYGNIGEKFFNLHQGKKPQTFNALMEQAFQAKDVMGLCQQLSKRPTVFARQLDRLLRLEQEVATIKPYPSFVLFSFEQVAKEVPVPVLINLLTHFKYRGEAKEFRAFFPKGSLTRCYGIEEGLAPLPSFIVERVVSVIEEAVIHQFSQKEALGKVYLDEALKQYAVPFTQRTSSKSLQTIARYSRLDVSQHTHLRPFIYWQEAGGKRCDLDLSLIVFTDEFVELDTVSYFNLKSGGMTHSGDFVSAKEGASEYVEIDLDTVEKRGGRYGVVMVNSYSMTPFCELPDCFCGFMGRDGWSGETFEPKAVKQKFDLSTHATVCVPAIIDFKTREVIWVDMVVSHDEVLNNAYTTQSAANYLLRSLIYTHKPTLYDLFDLHIKARGGELVEHEDEADTIFGGATGLQPWDYNTILADYLG